MDGRASVLFVVTIPTAAEEERLKREFLSKKHNLMQPEQVTNTPISKNLNPLSVDSCKTSASLYTTPKPFGETKQNEDQFNNDNADIVSTTTADVPTLTVDNSAIDEEAEELRSRTRKLSDNSTTIKVQEPACYFKDSEINSIDKLPSSCKTSEITKDRQKSLKKKEHYGELGLKEDTCMEVVLKEILNKFQVHGATWTKNIEGVKYQIFFTVEFNETYERILHYLNEWGIGDREGSTVSVMNCITSKTYNIQQDYNESENDFCSENTTVQKQSAWERFMNSVRSRLNVANIIRDVRQDAAITFDFVVLLVSASILSSFGLVEDSTIFLASSMLISPLMGPIIAAIFGTVIKDHSLRRLGLKNEFLGILIAVFVGFLFGMIVCTTDERYSIGDGLTEEMLARSELHSLVVGVFTAIPSGAAAAIGILGGNIGSLVGVAISASLLPPAVNSGLLWALALIYKFFEKDESRYNSVVKNTLYSTNQANELAILGSISMCLTISNIICIYIMGILVLKVKEIAPVISRKNRYFWKHDIKIARDLNRNSLDTDAAIIDEFTNLPREDQRALGINYEFLRNIQLDESFYQNTWSPIGGRHPLETPYEEMRENYSTVHRLDKLYSTITHQHPKKEISHKFLLRRNTGRLADFGTSYKVSSENIPRCSTMPSNTICPTINNVTAENTITSSSIAGVSRSATATNTPTSTIDSRQKRKFIVTPAVEDPLYSVFSPLNSVDV